EETILGVLDPGVGHWTDVHLGTHQVRVRRPENTVGITEVAVCARQRSGVDASIACSSFSGSARPVIELQKARPRFEFITPSLDELDEVEPELALRVINKPDRP